jgi:hypothetical protein
MQDEGSKLLPGKQHIHDITKKRCLIMCCVLLVLLSLLGITAAFLFPRQPSLSILSIALPMATPVVALVPPTLTIPVNVTLQVVNDNFFGIYVLGGSSVTGTYFSAPLNTSVTLGESFPSHLTIGSRAATQFEIQVQLLYSLFASPVVLSEIVLECATNRFFLIHLDIHLLLDVLFLEDLAVDVQTLVNISCVVG